MARIKVELSHELIDGQQVTFVAPCNCNEVDGLKVCYPGSEKEFVFKDAHGNDLTGIGELFTAGVYVNAILDVVNGYAYLLNADTNAYLEQAIKTPVFDLVELGLAAVHMSGGGAFVETDTAEIRAALDKGSVAFVIAFTDGENTIQGRITMNGANANGTYQCISIVNYATPGTVTVNITDTMILAEYSPMTNNSGGSGGSGSAAETPVFDLVAMGLSTVPMPLGYASIQADTSEIRAALRKGPAIFNIAFEFNDQTTQVMLTMAGVGDGSWYQQVTVAAFGGSAIVIVTVTENSISVSSSPPDAILGVPTSIDLSGFESNGEIVETFPDGSVKTTVMEFNSDGKPTKITDSNGNVTTLTW